MNSDIPIVITSAKNNTYNTRTISAPKRDVDTTIGSLKYIFKFLLINPVIKMFPLVYNYIFAYLVPKEIIT